MTAPHVDARSLYAADWTATNLRWQLTADRAEKAALDQLAQGGGQQERAVVGRRVMDSKCPTAGWALEAESCLDGLRDDTGRSSVDGREIRFTNSTKYDAQSHAHTGRTNSGLSQIKLKGDAWNTSNDLDWKDKNKNDGALATWTRHGDIGTTDTIEMNDYYLHQGSPGTWDTPFYRRAAAAHELGHALGLCHKSAAYGASVMVKSAGDIPSIKPTSRDRGDYHKLWGWSA
ncbi:hypothetical protein [Streptomyces sp. NPDC049813]|uniref:hypothetical protein n=1 Tax=Streptomyces sp. NPDC049813 TaxID=3365597 RepID=UPI003796AD9A